MVERITDRTLSFGFFNSLTFLSIIVPPTRMTSATTAMPMNIRRHPKLSITRPPTTGPIAGPAAMTIPAMPMAVPRLSGG